MAERKAEDDASAVKRLVRGMSDGFDAVGRQLKVEREWKDGVPEDVALNAVCTLLLAFIARFPQPRAVLRAAINALSAEAATLPPDRTSVH